MYNLVKHPLSLVESVTIVMYSVMYSSMFGPLLLVVILYTVNSPKIQLIVIMVPIAIGYTVNNT